VTAKALQTPTVDVDQLRAAIKGKSAADAKAYLSKYGDAEVSISPFWASTVSGFDFRIDLQVVAPTAQPTAVGSQAAGLPPKTRASQSPLLASPVPSDASVTAASSEASATATP
jgi:hypothetical protein